MCLQFKLLTLRHSCHGPLLPPPLAAARSRVCRGSLHGLPFAGLTHTDGCWADYGPPIAAARPVICHGTPVQTSSFCCQARNLYIGPLYRLLMLL
ncbi:unnamed protein product, partial [Staurois parvus]